MTYQDYIQSIDAAWLAAQRRGDVEEEQTLAAILYRLVQPPAAALSFLVDLLGQTTDPVRCMRYEQAIAQVQQCQEQEPSPTVPPPQAHDPISAEQLAQLFHERYEALAPQFGYEMRKKSRVPWAEVPAQNKNLMIAVARDVLQVIRTEEQPIRIWRTATELAGTNQERKQYFIILEDGDRPDLRFILQRHADGHIIAEPYVDHEYDYTQDDGDEEDEDFNEDDYVDCSDDEPEDELLKD